MALPSKPSPLGPRNKAPSRPATTTSSSSSSSSSSSDTITARIRRHHQASTAKRYEGQPWLKKTPVQTRQMLRVRRVFYRIQSAFYWETIRDSVMGEQQRATNRYFLEPITTVVTSPAYRRLVARPMDFGAMRRRWHAGAYLGDASAVVSDFGLMVDNAVAYYPRGHRVRAAAEKLRGIFEDGIECGRWSEWMNSAVAVANEEGLEV